MSVDDMATRRGRRLAFTAAERWSIWGMAAIVITLHVVGFGLLFYTVASGLELGSTGVFGVGLGITAYMLGMRHAFDADHIAAIDNTTRKLMAEKTDQGRPLSVGLHFSLGHSSVVLGLCVLIALGIRAVGSQVQDDSSTLQETTGLIGTSISGTFLIVIGLVNAVILVGIVRVFRDMRSGAFDEATLEDHLARRGFMNRILGGITKGVRRPWHMYPVGLLFGLGFDTATEVSLLVLAAGAATYQLPWYALLVLPILFAAGMSLLDSLDGIFMGLAYDWALLRPVRKVYYNMTITGLSVLVALGIGGIEIIGLLGEKAGVTTGPVAWIGGIDLSSVGYAIVGLFLATWAIAYAIWRFGHIEERWTADLADSRVRGSG